MYSSLWNLNISWALALEFNYDIYHVYYYFPVILTYKAYKSSFSCANRNSLQDCGSLTNDVASSDDRVHSESYPHRDCKNRKLVVYSY